MAENKRYTTQKKQNSGQDNVIKDDLYLFSIPTGSSEDLTLVLNPQSKQVRYVKGGTGGTGTSGTSGSSGGANTSGTSGAAGSSGSSGSSGI
jgi:hypothetical protein